MAEPSTTSIGRAPHAARRRGRRRRPSRTARPISARCGSASASPGASTGSHATPAARSRSIQTSRGSAGKIVVPALRPGLQQAAHLLGVVAVGAGLVAEDLDDLVVHALAAEPDLQQLAVAAAVEEVREERALGPVRLDLGRRPLGAADHAAERGEHPVVQRGLGPAARADRAPGGAAAPARRRSAGRPRPMALARTSTSIGPGRWAASWVQNPARASTSRAKSSTSPAAVRLGRQRAYTSDGLAARTSSQPRPRPSTSASAP